MLAECDYIIHLGDGISDMRAVFPAYPEKTYLLAGNNDFYGGESELVLDVEQRRIFRLPRAPLRGEGRHGAPCRRRA